MNCEAGGGQEEGAKKSLKKCFLWGLCLSPVVQELESRHFFYLAWQQVSGSLNGRVDFRLLAVVYFGSKSRWQVSKCEAPLCFFAFLFWVFFLVAGFVQESRSLEKLLPGNSGGCDHVQTYS